MIHYYILDDERREILPLLGEFKNQFYLAGETGLALQIGHRDSVDFDFFTETDYDTALLFQKVEKVFAGRKIDEVQNETGTITIIVDGKIRISFLYYPYKLLLPPIDEPFLKIASIADIAAMKISAITSRAAFKDYVDMFFIFNHLPFKKIIAYSREKMPFLDENLIRKSMVYFDDIKEEELIFKTSARPSLEDVKERIRREVLAP